MTTENEYHGLLFGVWRSIRYHNRRRSFYDHFNLFVNAFSLIMGSATVLGTLRDQWQNVAILAAMMVTILAAINLVVGSSRQARLHHDLGKRFISLEKEITSCQDKNENNLAQFISERLDIEAEQSPVLHLLNSIRHNELARAMGYGEEQCARITPLQRFFSPIIDIQEHTIRLGDNPI